MAARTKRAIAWDEATQTVVMFGGEGSGGPEPFVKAPLCADWDGFSLHAGARVAAGDHRRREHLLRV